jgi:hypothetical protein
MRRGLKSAFVPAGLTWHSAWWCWVIEDAPAVARRGCVGYSPGQRSEYFRTVKQEKTETQMKADARRTRRWHGAVHRPCVTHSIFRHGLRKLSNGHSRRPLWIIGRLSNGIRLVAYASLRIFHRVPETHPTPDTIIGSIGNFCPITLSAVSTQPVT